MSIFGEYTCPHCKATFATASDDDLYALDEEKKCSDCGKTFLLNCTGAELYFDTKMEPPQ